MKKMRYHFLQNFFFSYTTSRTYWLYEKINTGKILLHHGSTSSKEELKLVAKEELFKANKTTPIEIVTNKNKEFKV